MHRSKLAKIILLAIISPFILYYLGSCVVNLIPPTESYKKTPQQFEELFNQNMAQYGMSIDVDSGEYTDADRMSKTVPIVCEDGSKVFCTFYPTGTGSRSLIFKLEFSQELSGKAEETVYLEPLLAFVMDSFAPGMTENKGESFEPYTSETYHGALLVCGEFIEGKEEKRSFYISPERSNEFLVTLNRKTDEKTTLSVRILFWNN